MTTKRLHELIELALSGKKFRARQENSHDWFGEAHFSLLPQWSLSAIIAVWEYKEIREPLVLWINEYPKGLSGVYFDTKEDADQGAANHRIACRKFVEVIE